MIIVIIIVTIVLITVIITIIMMTTVMIITMTKAITKIQIITILIIFQYRSISDCKEEKKEKKKNCFLHVIYFNLAPCKIYKHNNQVFEIPIPPYLPAPPPQRPSLFFLTQYHFTTQPHPIAHPSTHYIIL